MQFDPFKQYPIFLKKVNPHCVIRMFDTGDILMKEDSLSDTLFWILKGSCKCDKKVQFVQKTITHQLTPYNGKKLEADEELVTKEATIQELDVGDHFPGVPRSLPELKELGVHDESVKSVCRQAVQYRVVALNKMMVVALPMMEFIKNAPEELVHELLNLKNIYQPDANLLQEAIIERKKWDQYKKGVIHQVQKK